MHIASPGQRQQVDTLTRQRGRLARTWRLLSQPQVYMAYVFLAPAFLGLLVFTFLPFFASLYFSFTQYNVLSPPQWIGLGNYERLINSQVFWIALRNVSYYTLGTLIPKMILGLTFAILLNQALRGVAFFRAAFYAPVVTSMVAVSIAWLWIYHPNSGLLNQFLTWLGLPRQLWLLDKNLALPSLMLMGIWKYAGISMVIYLAGLQGIPESYYEAADIDGANGWNKFFYITLPLLAPASFYIFLTTAISSFQVFEQMYVLTQGGPGFATTSVVYEIYGEAFQRFRMGYASAMAFVLFIIILILTLISFKFGNREIEY
ncbi:MAG: sugar ABC transporter permease [Caldilineaceae bacterium]|nr:sugar ABC transporter permease [Caldilineaceae bacterium]